VTPAVLAQSVADLLDDLGVHTPHLAGNSLGGWVALELASRRPVASLTLLSPAGLWRQNTPLYDWISLSASRWLARHAGRLLSRVVASRLGRALVLGQTHGHPMRLSTEYARAAVTELGRCPGFEVALAGTAKRHFVATGPITAPVTVAFGSRDLLLLRGSRRLGQLPPQTRVEALPGCGHIPIADDPAAVAALLTQTATQADRGATQAA
jgi:pimeloyl-ACP methyl ester carboxylesterase